MNKQGLAAKPSALTYDLLRASHANITAELRRIADGFRPYGSRDEITLRRMLESIESMLDACRSQHLH